MSTVAQLKLAGSSGGRILLHIMTLLSDHHLAWHWAGIAREFKQFAPHAA